MFIGQQKFFFFKKTSINLYFLFRFVSELIFFSSNKLNDAKKLINTEQRPVLARFVRIDDFQTIKFVAQIMRIREMSSSIHELMR